MDNIKKKRIYGLDSIRGIAALIVVIYHYTTRYNELFGHESNLTVLGFPIGKYGVQLFFLLSGFVIMMTVQNTSIVAFVKKRWIRLMPIYMVGVLITYTVVSIFKLPNRAVSFPELLINFTMLQGYIPDLAHVDGVYWTLVVELTFYIIMTAVLILKLEKHMHLVSFLWLLGSGILLIINSQISFWVFGRLTIYTNAEYCYLFILGIMIYHIRQNNKDKRSYMIIALAFLFSYLYSSFIEFIVTLCVFVIILLVVNVEIKVLNHRILVILGEISYSLYLIHQNIGYIIIRFINTYFSQIGPFYLIFPLVFSISLALILTYFIDIPVRKSLYKIFVK